MVCIWLTPCLLHLMLYHENFPSLLNSLRKHIYIKQVLLKILDIQKIEQYDKFLDTQHSTSVTSAFCHSEYVVFNECIPSVVWMIHDLFKHFSVIVNLDDF